MANMTLKNVEKRYPNGFEAVKNVSVEIEDKEIVVFMGPSGCGKSTLFRMLAGLETITSGEIIIGDTVVNELEPKDRDIAMLFENYALYPTLSVYENLAFGLRLRECGAEEIEERVLETAQIMNLTHLLNRKPRALSEIQQHRLAMGRAIICRPKVLLMNDPFMYIPQKYRKALYAELVNLQKRLGITIAYVSNTYEEACRIGNKIVIMNKGNVVQMGTAKEIERHPNNMLVAGYFGKGRMKFRDVVCKVQDGKVILDAKVYRVELPEEKGQKLLDAGYEGKTVVMGLRQEDEYEEILEIDGEKVFVFDKETELIIAD